MNRLSENKQKGSTVVVTVSTIVERDKLIKKIYTHLTKEPSVKFTVVQDRINRVCIYHNTNVGKLLIKTYLVIIIPITIDLSPLLGFNGAVHFHLDDTVKHLRDLLTKVEALQGYHNMKGNNNGKTLEQLVNCLSNTNG